MGGGGYVNVLFDINSHCMFTFILKIGKKYK